MNRIKIYQDADQFYREKMEPALNNLAEAVLAEMKKTHKTYDDIEATEAWKERVSNRVKEESEVFGDVMNDYFTELKDYEEGKEEEPEEPEVGEEEGEELELPADEAPVEGGGEAAPAVPEDLEAELAGEAPAEGAPAEAPAGGEEGGLEDILAAPAEEVPAEGGEEEAPEAPAAEEEGEEKKEEEEEEKA